MWPDSRVTDLLGIEHPILLAGMKGEATPDLAAAVSNAGGLGAVGLGVPAPDQVAEVSAALRARTNKPFALNLWVLEKAEPERLMVSPEVRARLQGWYDRLGAGEVPERVAPPPAGLSEALVDALVAGRPSVVVLHFGIPEARVIGRLKAAGVRLISTATTVAEARALEAAGMDAIIAQGWEAGGHRGSHKPTRPGDGVGTMALVPQVVDAVRVPVIATGGISDGRGIAAAFALGAAGVQLGSAFLRCPEAGTGAGTRARLEAAADSDTMVTDAVSGRSARAVRSAYAMDMADLAGRLPPYVSMYGLSGPLEAASAGRADEPATFHLFGQAAALGRAEPAADVVARLVSEAQGVMGRFAGRDPAGF
jgi:nitronate monooxygenase